MMKTVEINGKSYTLRKMPVMKQFHVARRISPIIAKMVSGDTMDEAVKELATLSDKDSEYVLSSCLDVVTYRDEENKRDFPVQASNGMLAYDHIDLAVMLSLVAEVLRFNLEGFMNAPPSILRDGAGDQVSAS